MFKTNMPHLVMEGWRSKKDFDAHGGWTTNISIPFISFKEHKGQYIQCKIGFNQMTWNTWTKCMRISHVQLQKVKTTFIIIDHAKMQLVA